MLMLLLLTVFVQSSRSVPATAHGDDDRAILEAVVSDPQLIAATDCGRYDLHRTTHLAAITYVEPPFGHISLADGRDSFDVPEELVESTRVRNQRPVSTRGVTRPRPTSCSGATAANPWGRVSLSRPGVSADGLRAVVVVLGTEKGIGAHGGFVAYLEKRSGEWLVAGRSGRWVE